MKILVALLMLWAVPAFAQNPMTTFMGIQFGSHLSPEQECPKRPIWAGSKAVFSHPEEVKTLCWESMATPEVHSDDISFHNIPNFTDLNGNDLYKVYGTIVDTTVEQIGFGFPVADGKTILAALKNKYGSRCVTASTPVHNGLGVEFTRATVTWKLPKFTIVFSSIGQDVDEGSVEAITPNFIAHEKKVASNSVRSIGKAF